MLTCAKQLKYSCTERVQIMFYLKLLVNVVQGEGKYLLKLVEY